MATINIDDVDLELGLGLTVSEDNVSENAVSEDALSEDAVRDIVLEVKTFIIDMIETLAHSISPTEVGNKRKYSQAFVIDYGVNTFDDVRYGQHIGVGFFDANFGHNVYEAEGSDFYRTNRNLFNV